MAPLLLLTPFLYYWTKHKCSYVFIITGRLSREICLWFHNDISFKHTKFQRHVLNLGGWQACGYVYQASTFRIPYCEWGSKGYHNQINSCWGVLAPGGWGKVVRISKPEGSVLLQAESIVKHRFVIIEINLHSLPTTRAFLDTNRWITGQAHFANIVCVNSGSRCHSRAWLCRDSWSAWLFNFPGM